MALEDPPEARPSHEVTDTGWEVSRSAGTGLAASVPSLCRREKMKQVNTLICRVLTETKCHCVHRQGAAVGVAQEV